MNPTNKFTLTLCSTQSETIERQQPVSLVYSVITYKVNFGKGRAASINSVINNSIRKLNLTITRSNGYTNLVVLDENPIANY